MIFIVMMLMVAVFLLWNDYDRENDRKEKDKREAFEEFVKVCPIAHRPWKPCMNGCEHSGPHICHGNGCLEHKKPVECASAYVYGYKKEAFEDFDKLPRLSD